VQFGAGLLDRPQSHATGGQQGGDVLMQLI
jgi:hypothetical protein